MSDLTRWDLITTEGSRPKTHVLVEQPDRPGLFDLGLFKTVCGRTLTGGYIERNQLGVNVTCGHCRRMCDVASGGPTW